MVSCPCLSRWLLSAAHVSTSYMSAPWLERLSILLFSYSGFCSVWAWLLQLCAGWSGESLKKLQSVQNMAACMVSRVCQREHITPVLKDLHWLPVSQRVVFKTALMVWKCHGVAPAYLSDLCVPATAISGRQHLQSAVTGTLLVPRTLTATGHQSFAVNRPATWNHLPPALRSPDLSESTFKRALFSTTVRHHRVELRKFYFTNRVVDAWNSLPNRIVMANSTNTFKHRLDIYWQLGKTRRLSTIFVHSYRAPEVVVTYSDWLNDYIDYVKVWNEAGIEA